MYLRRILLLILLVLTSLCARSGLVVSYDANGNKIKVEYAQVPEAMITADSTIYYDGAYKVYSTREYVGPFEFVDGKLEYTAFEGGYFDATEGAHYYVTDWQGNNVNVLNSKGRVAQTTMYYPYGEPTVEPQGQRYLFVGKAREHAGGRNSHDFGARNLTPYGRWSTMDPKSENSYNISPYAYCHGDPINYYGPNGKREWPVEDIPNVKPKHHSNDYGAKKSWTFSQRCRY